MSPRKSAACLVSIASFLLSAASPAIGQSTSIRHSEGDRPETGQIPKLLFPPGGDGSATGFGDRPISGWPLLEATAVSADGLTIDGVGTGAPGFAGGSAAELTEPPPRIIWSDPPDGAIDARCDVSAPGQTSRGIDLLRLRFDVAVRSPLTHGLLEPQDFETTDLNGTAPAILYVEPLHQSANTFEIGLDGPIRVGTWTTILAHVENEDGAPIQEGVDDRIVFGFLPGDVNADGTSSPSDILDLIDSLNGVEPLPIWSTDIDRSGLAAPADILRIVDLLNGVQTTRPWNGMRLPPRP